MIRSRFGVAVLLVSAIVASLVCGWLIDRTRLSNQISGLNDSVSESNLMLLERWSDKSLILRIATRQQQLGENSEVNGFKNIDEVIRYELVRCVSECFVMENAIARTEIHPTASEFARSALKYLNPKDREDFFEIADSLGFRQEIFPHFQPSSSKHSEFVAFFDRCFQDEK